MKNLWVPPQWNRELNKNNKFRDEWIGSCPLKKCWCLVCAKLPLLIKVVLYKEVCILKVSVVFHSYFFEDFIIKRTVALLYLRTKNCTLFEHGNETFDSSPQSYCLSYNTKLIINCSFRLLCWLSALPFPHDFYMSHAW